VKIAFYPLFEGARARRAPDSASHAVLWAVRRSERSEGAPARPPSDA
jgi:hypothetical protein